MKKNLFLILFLLWSIGFAAITRAEPPKQYRYGGLNGITLVWNGSWEVGVGSFEGGIGYKRWISDRVVIKSFLIFGKVDTTIINDEYFPTYYRLKEKSFSLLAGLEDHFWRRNRLSFFWGGSFQFSTISSKIDYSSQFEPPIGLEEESISRNIYTIQALLGLEYFLFKHLSISGQYLIDLSLVKQSRKGILVDYIHTLRTETQKTTSWSLSTGTSLLMFTVYL
jgi:hypothetical protein